MPDVVVRHERCSTIATTTGAATSNDGALSQSSSSAWRRRSPSAPASDGQLALSVLGMMLDERGRDELGPSLPKEDGETVVPKHTREADRTVSSFPSTCHASRSSFSRSRFSVQVSTLPNHRTLSRLPRLLARRRGLRPRDPARAALAPRARVRQRTDACPGARRRRTPAPAAGIIGAAPARRATG